MKRQKLKIILQITLLLFFSCSRTLCSPYTQSNLLEIEHDSASPSISPSADPPSLQPVTPSPMIPFKPNGVPKLSGHCSFNFTAAESLLRMTAADCWSPLAPYLANVVCCPQLEASLVILLGQSGSRRGRLALNATEAKDCLADVEQIIESQGANENLHKICPVHSSNLTESSCPVIRVNEIETIIDSSTLLAACEKLDPQTECCNQVCQNAISDAAAKIVARNYSTSNIKTTQLLPEHSTSLNDCKRIVLRWLASKFDPSSTNKFLRGLFSCKINKECPLDFPDIANVSTECGNLITNQTSCCLAMGSYLSHLQDQSFITNLQALSCATSLGIMLQKVNVSSNIYDLCHVNLKDFSLQVDSKDSGCLLPSLPSDVTYDSTSGVGFICDLNDNVRAPWPNASSSDASSCHKTGADGLPELPKATSDASGKHVKDTKIYLILAPIMILSLLV